MLFALAQDGWLEGWVGYYSDESAHPIVTTHLDGYGKAIYVSDGRDCEIFRKPRPRLFERAVRRTTFESGGTLKFSYMLSASGVARIEIRSVDETALHGVLAITSDKEEWKEGALNVLAAGERKVKIVVRVEQGTLWLGRVCWTKGFELPALSKDEARAAVELLDRLSDDSPDVRVRATRELVAKGLAVYDLVRGTLAETSDPEVRARCENILSRLRVGFADVR